MVWNQLKRHVAKVQPHNKDELIQSIHEFWNTVLTPELCIRYIDHIFKVVPLVVKMKGKAMGDIPKRLFRMCSEGKDLPYFVNLLETDNIERKFKALTEGDNGEPVTIAE